MLWCALCFYHRNDFADRPFDQCKRPTTMTTIQLYRVYRTHATSVMRSLFELHIERINWIETKWKTGECCHWVTIYKNAEWERQNKPNENDEEEKERRRRRKNEDSGVWFMGGKAADKFVFSCFNTSKSRRCSHRLPIPHSARLVRVVSIVLRTNLLAYNIDLYAITHNRTRA